MTEPRGPQGPRRRAETAAAKILGSLAPRALERLGADAADAFLTRLDQVFLDVFEPLDALYGARTDTADLVQMLAGSALEATTARSPSLRRLDRRREIDSSWFQRSRLVGYVCYVDRFATTLNPPPLAAVSKAAVVTTLPISLASSTASPLV